VSTLADLARARTDLDEPALDRLHRLVGEWQLIADLSFSDLVLRVRTAEGSWLTLAHVRPVTGPTTWPTDVVGTELPAAASRRLERAAVSGRIVRDGEVERRGRLQVRSEVVPVPFDGRVVAVLTSETDLGAARLPSALELTYLTTAGELLQMVGEGRFPTGPPLDVEGAPRVGDGLVRLDRTGHAVYASPNALSAFRRLGVAGDVVGSHLGSVIARLAAGPGELDEPRGSAALAAVLRFGEPREAEVEAQGAVVQLRALPLAPGGEPRGALVLVRDVSELRRRDRAILGKDATIREIHHRVKNNLQTVAALLRLQARRTDQPQARAALEESVRRVGSIALVHEVLSQTPEGAVPFDEVAERVLATSAEVAAPETSVQVRRSGSFGELPAEVATALAMALTELVQNAVEHGYPAGAAGLVQVRVERGEDRLVVRVEDDGAGLPDGFAVEGASRLGLQIVRTLVEGELRGRLELRPRERGTAAVVELPLSASSGGR
jgi:two-component system, sensor histidine kinase PdtaS